MNTTTTYSKEYSDNSHVWLTPVADYAPMMIAHGCTFADFEAKHPRLAQSEYGQDLKATLEHLSNREALVIDNEEFVAEDTMMDAEEYLESLEQAVATNYHKPVKDFIQQLYNYDDDLAMTITTMSFILCRNRGYTSWDQMKDAILESKEVIEGILK